MGRGSPISSFLLRLELLPLDAALLAAAVAVAVADMVGARANQAKSDRWSLQCQIWGKIERCELIHYGLRLRQDHPGVSIL